MSQDPEIIEWMPPGTQFIYLGRDCVVLRYCSPAEANHTGNFGMQYQYTDRNGIIRSGEVVPRDFAAFRKAVSLPSANREPQRQWCPVHRKWETQEEWSACDDDLHARGYRNVGGVPMQAAEPFGMDAVLEQIRTERQRQVVVEGYSRAHDDEHDAGELAGAAACYAIRATEQAEAIANGPLAHPECIDAPPRQYIYFERAPPLDRPIWRFDSSYWKPRDQRSNLVKAGALIVAEIERIDRAAAKESS